MISIVSMDTNEVHLLQSGGLDANGQVPERVISDGEGNPCRHCFEYIDNNEEMLILAHRPFADIQPYAEIGPIFLHAKECKRYKGNFLSELPQTLKSNSHYILRGYDEHERIVYGTGRVTSNDEICFQANEIFTNSKVDFIHIRSATNNCYHSRIDRN
jgi:hypothetical protein